MITEYILLDFFIIFIGLFILVYFLGEIFTNWLFTGNLFPSKKKKKKTDDVLKYIFGKIYDKLK